MSGMEDVLPSWIGLIGSGSRKGIMKSCDEEGNEMAISRGTRKERGKSVLCENVFDSYFARMYSSFVASEVVGVGFRTPETESKKNMHYEEQDNVEES